MVQITDKDSILIAAMEMCGELQVELARAIIYGRDEYEILRKYYNLSASLQNAGIYVNADIGILRNQNQKSELAFRQENYNPFDDIQSEADILAAVESFLKTKSISYDESFFDNAEKMLLTALFLYVWKECPKTERNIGCVIHFLQSALEDCKKSNDSALSKRLFGLKEKDLDPLVFKYYSEFQQATAHSQEFIIRNCLKRMEEV